MDENLESTYQRKDSSDLLKSKKSHKSNNSKIIVQKSFKEDFAKSINRRKNSQKTMSKTHSKKKYGQKLYESNMLKRMKIQSDDESDAIRTYSTNMQNNIFDDSLMANDFQTKNKVTYFNVMLIGKSHSGKFDFVKFIFDECFKRPLQIDSEQKKFREMSHRIPYGRRGCKIVSLIHS